MNSFSELIEDCTTFTLTGLKEIEDKAIFALQTFGASSSIKALQLISLEKAILAVGIFSIFEGILQDHLKCKNGFAQTKNILKQKEEWDLLSRFINLELAINALKHGRGKSYNALLVENEKSNNAKIKQSDNHFLNEGDISEVNTLIEVDDNFIYRCVETIKLISEKIEKIQPEIKF